MALEEEWIRQQLDPEQANAAHQGNDPIAISFEHSGPLTDPCATDLTTETEIILDNIGGLAEWASWYTFASTIRGATYAKGVWDQTPTWFVFDDDLVYREPSVSWGTGAISANYPPGNDYGTTSRSYDIYNDVATEDDAFITGKGWLGPSCPDDSGNWYAIAGLATWGTRIGFEPVPPFPYWNTNGSQHPDPGSAAQIPLSDFTTWRIYSVPQGGPWSLVGTYGVDGGAPYDGDAKAADDLQSVEMFCMPGTGAIGFACTTTVNTANAGFYILSGGSLSKRSSNGSYFGMSYSGGYAFWFFNGEFDTLQIYPGGSVSLGFTAFPAITELDGGRVRIWDTTTNDAYIVDSAGNITREESCDNNQINSQRPGGTEYGQSGGVNNDVMSRSIFDCNQTVTTQPSDVVAVVEVETYTSFQCWVQLEMFEVTSFTPGATTRMPEVIVEWTKVEPTYDEDEESDTFGQIIDFTVKKEPTNIFFPELTDDIVFDHRVNEGLWASTDTLPDPALGEILQGEVMNGPMLAVQPGWYELRVKYESNCVGGSVAGRIFYVGQADEQYAVAFGRSNQTVPPLDLLDEE